MDESLDFTVMDDSAADEDWLKDGTHQKIADRLFDLITEPNTKGLTIGLEGSWGSGKSTVVNLLKKKLDERNRQNEGEKTFVFYIDSWAHEGDFLRRAFLERFARQLQSSCRKDGSIQELEDKISNRVITKNTHTEPVITWFTKVCAFLLVFLVPTGFLFIDHGLDKSSLDCNCFIKIGVVLVFSPLLWALVTCLNNFRIRRREEKKKSSKEKCEENKKEEYAETQKSLMPVFWTTDTTETVTNETTKEPEKTSLEFEKFFEQLLEKTYANGLKRVICVIDNLDRINPEDALKIWSTLQIFVELKNDSSNKSKVWVIVPYDESGLRLLWDKNELGGKDKSRCSKSFFDKSFQLRIEVPKMLFEGWEDYAKKIIEKTLIGYEEKDRVVVLETLKRGRENISDAPSPREIKTYVNQVGFLYSLHKRNNISLETLCFYVDLRYLHSKNVEEIRNSLIEGAILPKNQVLGLLNDKNKIEKELCGIIFNVEAEKGIELLLENPVIDALERNDVEEMMKLTRNHENAVLTFVEKILTENKHDCKNYISLLTSVFGTRIENTLLSFISVWQKTICERMGDIPLIENLGSIFNIVKKSSDQVLLKELSETFVSNQLSRLKPDSNLSIVGDILEKFEFISDIVNDDKLIYYDYTQLGTDVFILIAKTIDSRKMEKIGKLIKNTESLDSDVSKKIDVNNLNFEKTFCLACCTGLLQWNSSLAAINKVISSLQNPPPKNDAFVSCVNLIFVLQNYDLQKEKDAIISIIKQPVFWNYVAANINKVNVAAAYLLAKYGDDLNLPQIQLSGQALNGYNSVKAMFVEKKDEVIEGFCEKINATKKGGFVWALAKHPKYKLIGGIIKKQLEDGRRWFFNVENPFECFANAIEYTDDENVRIQLLMEFENSTQLISNVQDGEAVITSRLKACSLLLKSEYSNKIVKKVEKELAEKNKEEWANALNGNTELLNIVRKCRKIDGKPLDELGNDYAEAFIQFLKTKISDDGQNNVELGELYDCMKDSFKKFVSNEIVTEIIDRKFAVSAQIRGFLIEKIDYDTLIKSKSEDVTSIIKELVDEAKWNQLEFVIRLIDKLGDKFVPEAYYTDVMKKPLKLLDEKAEPEQKEVVEMLCEFFDVDLSLVEEQTEEDA